MIRGDGGQRLSKPMRISRARQAPPLYRQIYDRVRRGIAEGTYRPGGRLPSARDLASELGIARGTVEEAYALLVAEGYIERRGQSGSVIASGLADATVTKMLEPVARPRRAVSASRKGTEPLRSPFQLGQPALDAFPMSTWSRFVARQSRKPTSGWVDPAGDLALREAIASYLALSRGVTCAPEQVLITNGYQGAIDLVARSLLRGGDKAWFEEPGYGIARDAVLAAGATIIPVRVDAEGMRVGDAMRAAPKARLAVTTPAHHSPFCVTLSLQRRLQLLEWAAEREAYVVEDDYDGEFHYGGRPLPALKSLDRDDRVIYAGSFSKTLLPDLRLGYIVCPAELLSRLATAARVSATAPGSLMQKVVAAFMQEGQFVRHLHRMRRLYARRREALVIALRATFDEHASVESQPGGMQLLLKLPAHVDDRRVAKLAADAGLGVGALSEAYFAQPRQRGIMLGFANVPEEKAQLMARKLGRAIAAGLE